MADFKATDSICISRIHTVLDSLSIQYETVEHQATPTVEDLVQVMTTGKHDVIPCKNLFFKHKKKKTRWLLVLKPDRQMNPKTIGQFLGVGGGSLRFVSADEMTKLLGVTQGSVTPFGVMNDPEKIVEVVIDKALIGDKRLGVHPLICEATTFISSNDLCAFLKHHDHEPTIMDFDAEPQVKVAEPKKKVQKKQKKKTAAEEEKSNRGGLTCTREEDFPRWYSDVVTKGEMIEYYDISGCYILRPDSYFIWEQIQEFFNKNLKRLGIRNCYFPMFVSKRALEAEADHIEGFSPEVAWVTKSGKSDLAIPIAIRPTSETIMYPAFAKWIKSHRDLPIRLNQWSNIVRWEFKNPTPFIRTREFLWQEGHSAFETKAEADEEVRAILDIYARVYEELLAVPVIQGVKTETEKFPGGDYTTTVETFIPATGRAVQGGTSHGLGQNFGKIFNIQFEDRDKKKAIPWQNSWGLTTRTIGVMIMQHGDDKGLVIPPRVAAFQAVVIPIVYKQSDEERSQFETAYKKLVSDLSGNDVRTYLDDRDNYNPGWKFNHWEVRGVPLRIEFGPKDMKKNQCVLVRRDSGARETCSLDSVSARVAELLELIHNDMFARAQEKMSSKKRVVSTWDEFTRALGERCFILAPSCDVAACEESVKERTRTTDEDETAAEETAGEGEIFEKMTGAAKTLCIPFDQPELAEATSCVGCSEKATKWILYGRSY
eukprot:183677_1